MSEATTDLLVFGGSWFRKKPVKIEAARLENDPPDHAQELVQRMRDAGADAAPGLNLATDESYVLIRTLEGEMRAEVGDWIIRGVAGEFYPCKPDIFEATYERADDED